MFDSVFGSIRSFAVLIIVGILGLVALGILFRMIRTWQAAGTSKSWSSTTGRVLSATVAARRNPGRNGVSYYPVVVYEYNIDGQHYTGNRLGFGSPVGVGIQAVVAQGLGKYPVGSNLPVYYNPNNPADAVLERRTMGNWGNILILLILIVAMGIVVTSFGGIKLPFLR